MANRIAFALALALAVLAPAVPVGAAGTVTIGSATAAGGTLSVSGGSTYTDQPYVLLGTDAVDAPALNPHAADITGAAASTAASGQLRLRWLVNSMPAAVYGSPAVAFGFTFCLNGENCFELDVQRFTLVPPGTAATGTLYRCADPSCNPGGQSTAQAGGFGVAFDPASNSITATLPSVAGVTPGATLTGVYVDVNGPVFSMLGTANPFTAQYDTGDGVGEINPYTVASKQVDVAIGARGQAPSSVTYTTTVSPNAAGAWSAAMSTAGLGGDLAVYARACFGAGNCGYASLDVTL